jgi:hypothetical protein
MCNNAAEFSASFADEEHELTLQAPNALAHR